MESPAEEKEMNHERKRAVVSGVVFVGVYVLSGALIRWRSYDMYLEALKVLTAVIGGDFPAGQEENLRKVTSVRTVGNEAKFLTVLEPHEGTSRVKSTRALDENTIEIKLVDGKVELLKLRNFYDVQAKPSVELYRNGSLLEKTE